MPISTLKNMSVPFESEPRNTPLLMPKLQYRFRVLFDSFGTGGDSRELTRQLVEVTRPTVSFEQITLDTYNSRSYLAGKHTWEPVTITLREDANNSIQKVIGQQLQRQFDFYEQSSAVSGGTYKFQTRIEILDGGNGDTSSAQIIDRFHLVGCYIENAAYQQLAYATSDAVTVQLTIRYDNAIQYGVDGDTILGVGEKIGRATRASDAGAIVSGGTNTSNIVSGGGGTVTV